jgi:hypothetical protein
MNNGKSKSMDECSVCCNAFNNAVFKSVQCRSCDIKICRKCIRTYLLGSHDNPHCMSCKIHWPKEFYIKHLLKSFVYGEYKEHRKDILYDTEISQIPSTMPAVKKYKQLVELTERLNANAVTRTNIKDQLRRLDMKEYYIRREIRDLETRITADTTDTEKKSFTQSCPGKGCRGYLSTRWKCESCNKETCSKCFIIKDED